MGDEDEPAAVAQSTVGARLAAELARDELAPETIDQLRSGLGSDAIPDPDPSGSIEARLQHLQSEVETVAAYNEAIEEFLDEHGIASQFVTNAREDIDTATRRLDALDSRATRHGDRLDDLEPVVKRRGARLDRIESRLGDVAETVEAYRERLDELEAALAALEDWRDALGDAFD